MNEVSPLCFGTPLWPSITSTTSMFSYILAIPSRTLLWVFLALSALLSALELFCTVRYYRPIEPAFLAYVPFLLAVSGVVPAALDFYQTRTQAISTIRQLAWIFYAEYGSSAAPGCIA